MAGLASTTQDLARLRKRWKEHIGTASFAHGLKAGSPGGRLSQVTAFGSNPGALEMFTYVPAQRAAAPALVVVLHGCTQTAEGYDLGSGWSTLADEYGFVLLYPQQTRANNPNACFNWFQPGDTDRGRGEALSIRQMVEKAATDHSVDRTRIFVTGLSAGGAMAAAMLSAYPDVFAGGGVVAGLPYGAAGNVHEALRAMSDAPDRSAAAWGDLVRGASSHGGRWPILSVWHGGADRVVEPGNADGLVKQWTDLHGVAPAPSASGMVDGHMRKVWRDTEGRDVVESFTITGMGHGAPLRAGRDAGKAGTAGAFMLDVGISSTHHMAAFWGLLAPRTDAARPTAAPRSRETAVQAKVLDGEILGPEDKTDEPEHRGPANYIESVIDNAFRAAGLRR